MHSLFSQLLNQAAEWKLQAKVLKEQETVLQAQVKLGGTNAWGVLASLFPSKEAVNQRWQWRRVTGVGNEE